MNYASLKTIKFIQNIHRLQALSRSISSKIMFKCFTAKGLVPYNALNFEIH